MAMSRSTISRSEIVALFVGLDAGDRGVELAAQLWVLVSNAVDLVDETRRLGSQFREQPVVGLDLFDVGAQRDAKIIERGKHIGLPIRSSERSGRSHLGRRNGALQLDSPRCRCLQRFGVVIVAIVAVCHGRSPHYLY